MISSIPDMGVELYVTAIYLARNRYLADHNILCSTPSHRSRSISGKRQIHIRSNSVFRNEPTSQFMHLVSQGLLSYSLSRIGNNYSTISIQSIRASHDLVATLLNPFRVIYPTYMQNIRPLKIADTVNIYPQGVPVKK
jgi:hypothetical protein